MVRLFPPANFLRLFFFLPRVFLLFVRVLFAGEHITHTHTSSACFMMAEHDKLVAVAAGGFLQRAHLKRLASETQYRPRLRAKPSAGSIRTSQLCCGGCRLAGRATASMNSWEPRGERGSMESGGQTRGEKRPNMSRHDDSRPQTYLRRARAHGRQKERESAE